MKNFVLQILFFVVLGAAFTSCKTSKVALPTTSKDSIATRVETITLHDTVVSIQKDSSFYAAYLDCVNGKVVLKDTTAQHKPGAYLKAPNVSIKNNQLRVDCYAEAQQRFLQWKETYIKEHQAVTIRVPYAVETPLSWWQQTEIIAGRIFLGLLAVVFILVGLRLLKIV